jgi:uncharacterized protein YceK
LIKTFVCTFLQVVTGGEVSLVKILKISLKVGIHVLCESVTISQCSTVGKSIVAKQNSLYGQRASEKKQKMKGRK